jgi:hypothetical protein
MLLRFSSNSENVYWNSVEIQGMLADIQFKFRDACWNSVQIPQVYWNTAEIQGILADIQFKLRECFLTFSSNSGNAC